MSQKILVAHCPDSGDRAPVEFAVGAARFTGASLVVAVVYPGGSPLERLSGAEFAHDVEPNGREGVEQLMIGLRAEGVDADLHVVEHSTPARGIAAAIEALEPGLAVLGSGRKGHVGRVSRGSTAERVIQGASCPVVVVPRGYERPATGWRTVGAAFAPSAEGGEALRAAVHLARAAGARVRTVMALSPKRAAEQSPGLLAAQHHEREDAEDVAARHRLGAEQMLADAIAEHAGEVEIESDVLFQDPAHALVAASANLDLLVMGSRAYGPLRAVLLGGVSRRVTAEAACPVLVLPRGVQDAIGDLIPTAGAPATPS
jgi:nucleotide-binding universal stress UspA family protein